MQILLIVFLVVAIALVGVILLQQGKGAGMGASFGAGASGTVFGAPGSGNALTKITTVLAIIFFSVALALGYLSSGDKVTQQEDIFDQAAKQEAAVQEKAATDLPVEESATPATDLPAEEKAPEMKTEVKPEASGDKKTEEKKDNGDQ